MDKKTELDSEDITTLLNTRTYKQYKEGVQSILDGKCPFCDPLSECNDVVGTSESGGRTYGWRAWHNPYPLDNTEEHVIIAPQRHITHCKEMGISDWENAGGLIRRFADKYSGGGIVWRFGNPALNAGSVRHLHVNVIVPDGKGEVRVPLAKDPEKVAEKKKVIEVFEKIRRMEEEGVKDPLDRLSERDLNRISGRMG